MRMLSCSLREFAGEGIMGCMRRVILLPALAIVAVILVGSGAAVFAAVTAPGDSGRVVQVDPLVVTPDPDAPAPATPRPTSTAPVAVTPHGSEDIGDDHGGNSGHGGGSDDSGDDSSGSGSSGKGSGGSDD